MKFISKNKNLIVFQVGRFVDGELETDDDEKIEILDRVDGVERVEEAKPRKQKAKSKKVKK